MYSLFALSSILYKSDCGWYKVHTFSPIPAVTTWGSWRHMFFSKFLSEGALTWRQLKWREMITRESHFSMFMRAESVQRSDTPVNTSTCWSSHRATAQFTLNFCYYLQVNQRKKMTHKDDQILDKVYFINPNLGFLLVTGMLNRHKHELHYNQIKCK